jgi:carboxyl-terminal processing protease
MISCFFHKAFLASLILFFCICGVGFSEDENQNFTTTSRMREETRYVVHLLEQAHLEAFPISDISSKDIIEDYVKKIDPHHLLVTQIFLNEQLARFGDSMSFYLRQGNLFPAFEIFKDYKGMALKRLEWIELYLKGSIDLASSDTFTPDRQKMPWPKDDAEANSLWKDRLRYELIAEILSTTWNHLWTERPFMQRCALLFARQKDFRIYLTGFKASSVFWDNSPFVWKSHRVGQPSDLYIFKERSERSGLDSINIENALIQTKLYSDEASSQKKMAERYERYKKNILEIDSLDIEELFLSAVMEQYDPYSCFFSADSMEDFSIAIHNSLIGIGAILSDENGYCTVRELIAGGPAELSGQIRVGDKIVGIAQGKDPSVDVVGIRLRKIVKFLRGPKGTEVRLLIDPMGTEGTARKTVSLIRDDVKLTTKLASGEIIQVPYGSEEIPIGVISLDLFYGSESDVEGVPNCTNDVIELIEKLKKEGMRGLIIDMRRNPGGLFKPSIDLTSLFIESGPVVQVKDSSGNLSEYIDKLSKVQWDGLLIVLTSRYSASSTEILAGALRDHGRALIVGDPTTHGKGTVQALIEVGQSFFSRFRKSKLGAVKLTFQKWYLPSGDSIQIRGVPADIVLPSINPYLPIGESDVPHALPWDAINPIPWAYSDQVAVTPELINLLGKKSLNRQKELPEFSALNTSIDFFKTKQDQKVFSLNLKERLAQKRSDEKTIHAIEKKFAQLKSVGFNQKKILLDSAQKAKDSKIDKLKSSSFLDDLNDANTEMLSEVGGLDHSTLDVHLRESVRIMADWVAVDAQNS